MFTLVQEFFSEFGFSAEVVNKTVSSVIAILFLLVLRRVVVRTIQSRMDDPEGLYRTRKTVTYVTTIVTILTLAWIWVDALDSVTTYIGLVSAGIAIALADVLKNLAGWAFVILRRPFRVGDRVEIGETIGDVVDVRLFRFSLLEVGNWVDADQSTGRLIHVPNGLLFTQRLANYTEGFEFIWHEIPVLVTFESDWRKAKQRIEEVLEANVPRVAGDAERRIRATAREYQIKIGALTPRTYVTVKDSGVLLTARFLVDVRGRRGADERFWEGVLDAFAEEPNVDLAYPTIRYHRDPSER